MIHSIGNGYFDFVSFHTSFFDGDRDDQQHVDMKKLSDAEIDTLMLFQNSVLERTNLKGRNKESHTDEHGNAIGSALSYAQCCVWHYHAGPYQNGVQNDTTPDLPVNLKGCGSAAIIHYIKDIPNRRIIVIGYSREHIPFPQANSRNNPLRHRMYTWRGRIVD
ncbi:hypothetical protein [Parachitinimonas caeni]|uniref:Uncharacterized protein n=1 Tax=Parachitinimonas caeni TaxID=3031301 RepID=A0ABT7E4F5_9NEIS|nr:hypothetical protein [Parachitinimonas caeni]MDK2126233.1 hypothetical protein [Parachitinimonas caeni]